MPSLVTADLRGELVHGCEPRGKHLLLHIGDFTVHSHFGMDGSWRLVPSRVDAPGQAGGVGRVRARSRAAVSWPAAHRIRALIGTDAVIALGLDLAKLELWPRNEDEARMAWLGPDLLADTPDLDEAVRQILSDPDRPLTAALLDQSNVAGLGNEYVTELLFLRGLRPDRIVAEVPNVPGLLELARRLLLANRDRVDRTFTGNTRPGERNYVFGRVGQPCRRCGTVIVAGTHASGVRDHRGRDGLAAGGTRASACCPACQR